MKHAYPFAALLAVVSTIFVACEPMDVVDPFGVVHDDDDSSSTSSSSSSSSASSSSSSGSLTGSWSGTSATGQVHTSLSLVQSGNSISGSLAWPGGDRRSVSGSRSGSSVTLRIGGGDVWHLTVSGNHMSGTGNKAGGGTYSLSFSR